MIMVTNNHSYTDSGLKSVVGEISFK